jgi:hypothetical protein
MKKISLVLILMFALTSIACQSGALIEKAKASSSMIDPAQIMNSTLLIVVENIEANRVTLAYDLASLVEYEGQTYLVTHNHWENMLKDENVLVLRDAEYHMIRTMFGSDFKKLIRYQDAGTMVLRVPDGISEALTAGNLDTAPRLKPGDTVQVAHWSYPNRDHLEVSDAVVVDQSILKEASVVTLRSLDGQTLHPGDSGGGVWYNGKLIANTWTVLTDVSTTVDSTGTAIAASETLTDLSHAAIFPEAFK